MIGLCAASVGACATPHQFALPAQWRRLPTEPYSHKQDDIFFVSETHGWYGNGDGKLYRTQNGGESWHLVWEQPGTFVRALGFMDHQNGFLGNLGAGFRPTITDPTPLYRTFDGGVTWRPVPVDDGGALRGVCAIDVLPRRIIFQGVTRTTFVIHAAGRAFGPAGVLRSLDGGSTWTFIDLQSRAGMILDVKFLDLNTGFVCAASSNDLELSNAAILRTEDGGATWTEVYRSGRPLELCWKMSFPSSRVGFATVQNNDDSNVSQRVIKTTDSGITWRELPFAEDAEMRELGIGFLTERHGWVGTSKGGYETRDGGRSWRAVDIGQSVNKIRFLRHDRGFTAFAIGTTVMRLDGDQVEA